MQLSYNITVDHLRKPFFSESYITLEGSSNCYVRYILYFFTTVEYIYNFFSI